MFAILGMIDTRRLWRREQDWESVRCGWMAFAPSLPFAWGGNNGRLKPADSH